MKRTARANAITPLTLLAAAAAGDAALTLRAAIEFDAQGNSRIPRFNILAYTGVPLRGVLKGQKAPIIVDLRGAEAKASIPALKDHSQSLIIGHTDSINNNGRELRMSGLVSGDGDVAREVLRSAKNGFPWQASISATVLEAYDVPRGQRVTVNGREWVGPLQVWSKSVIKEVSFVALGADADTTAAIAAANKEHPVKTFEEWLQAKGISMTDLTTEVEATLRASWQSEQDALEAAAATGEGAESGADGALDRELAPTRPAARKKVKAKAKKAKARSAKPATVRASAGSAGSGETDTGDEGEGESDDLNASDEDGEAEGRNFLTADDLVAERRRIAAIQRRCGGNQQLAAKAIEEGWTVEQAELAVLRASRPAIHATQGRDNANQGEVLEAALCRSAGMRSEFMEEQFSERTLEAASRGNMRNLSIQGLMYETIRAAGGHARIGSFDDETIRAAFQANQTLAASGFSSFTLPGILGAVANKALLQSFLAFNSVCEQVARIRTVRNFQLHTNYRLTGLGEFQKVAGDGELKHVGLDQATFTNQAETYGAMIALNRQQIRNDDLGAFLNIPQMLGRMSAVKREEVFFTLLLSNPSSFFHANNRNLISGGTTALSIAALTALEQKFLDQLDANSKPVGVMAATLLVPTGLKVTAEQLMTETRINETTTANAGKPANNPHAGKWKPVATPYLNNASFSGYSTTAFYLFANPADVAAMEIAYLDGKATPTIESGETSFNTLGMQWRGFFDFGIAMQDFRGAAKSAGA